jgi:hypothetical protein
LVAEMNQKTEERGYERRQKENKREKKYRRKKM